MSICHRQRVVCGMRVRTRTLSVFFFLKKTLLERKVKYVGLESRVLFSRPDWLTCCRYESDIKIYQHKYLNLKHQQPTREIRKKYNNIIINTRNSAFLSITA